jgi:hypothetical protein
MANSLTLAPSSGAVPDLSQSARARNSAILCLLLALLTMSVTAWFVVEGIQATEPDSPARWAKVASGVLLLILEAAAFWLAGQWLEHSKVLRALGWAVLALEITLMSVSQISIGMTAAKAASNGAGTVEEIRAQAKEARDAAAALRADAANLRGSKNAWLRQQAGAKTDAAAEQSKSAAAAVASLEKHDAATVSTPIVEIVGKGGLIGLSIALSVALSLSGIVLMHVAGSLWRRASGALPVDVQILELLQRIHGAPAAPVREAAVSEEPRSLNFKPAGAVAPKDASTGFSYSSKTALAGAGLLAAAAAPMAYAAPAVRATPPVNVNPPAPVNVSPSTVATPVNVDPSEPVQKARKARVARDGAVMDTGVGKHDGYRYRRALAGVKAGTMRPSRDGLFTAVGASPPTAKRYLEAMALAGEIVPNPNGRGWVLATKGGAA